MAEVHQDFETVPENIVGPAAVHVDHEADTAGIVLELRIVESLALRHGHPLLRSRIPNNSTDSGIDGLCWP
jgi:hypothetical protein